MSDKKVRNNAWPVLVMLSEFGNDVYKIPPGADGWHSRASLAAYLGPQLGFPAEIVEASFANLDKPGSYKFPTAVVSKPSQPAPTMTPQAAFDTGRITAQSRVDWEARFRADPVAVGQTLAGLAPVLAANHQAYTPKSAAEELDEINDAIFGVGHSEMSRQRQYAREDEQILADHHEVVRQQQEVADQTISADDWRQIYGTEPPEDIT